MMLQSLVFVGLGLLATQAEGASDPASVEGRWRLSFTLPITQTAPVLGEFERVMQMTAIVDFEKREGGLVQRTSPCSLEISGGNVAARVDVPDRFADAILVPPTEVMSSDGRIESELKDIYLGYDPASPSAPPPTSPDAPAVTDGDRDGHPGVTVVLKVLQFGRVELFVTQHLHLRLVGERTSPGRYQGDVGVIAFEQSLLGSAPSVPGLAEELAVRARTGTFTLERVTPQTTCATL